MNDDTKGKKPTHEMKAETQSVNPTTDYFFCYETFGARGIAEWRVHEDSFPMLKKQLAEQKKVISFHACDKDGGKSPFPRYVNLGSEHYLAWWLEIRQRSNILLPANLKQHNRPN